jgi:hypothetical protein
MYILNCQNVLSASDCMPPSDTVVKKRCSSYSFSTSVLDGGEWSASRPGHALAPGKGPPVPNVQEAGWAPEPVWTQRLEETSFRLFRGSNLHRVVVQPEARHYTDWATRLTSMHTAKYKSNMQINDRRCKPQSIREMYKTEYWSGPYRITAFSQKFHASRQSQHMTCSDNGHEKGNSSHSVNTDLRNIMYILHENSNLCKYGQVYTSFTVELTGSGEQQRRSGVYE